MAFDTPNPPYNANDPYATFLNYSCLDFLLIELVPLAHRTAADVTAREEACTSGPARDETAGQQQAGTAASSGKARIATTAAAVDDDETREAAFYRLEKLGYRVGQGVVERCVRGDGPSPFSVVCALIMLGPAG